MSEEAGLTKVQAKKKLVSEVITARKQEIFDMGLFDEQAGKRFMQVVATAIATNEKLVECSLESLILSIYDSARCGLAPNSITQEGHLIPFYSNKKKCYEAVFVVGYRGIINMLYATGHFSFVDIFSVYKNDEFFQSLGSDPRVHHIPLADGDRGAFIGAYALLKFKDGSSKHYYCSKSEGETHRDKFCRSKNKKGEVFGPWKDNFEAMVMKTALKKVAKYCPTSPASQKLFQAVTHDEKQEHPAITFPENNDIQTPEPLDIDPLTGEVIPPEKPEAENENS